VDKKGSVVERYAPMTPPSAIEGQIEKLLGKHSAFSIQHSAFNNWASNWLSRSPQRRCGNRKR